MNNRINKILLLPAICSIALSVLCSPAIAECSNKGQNIRATKSDNMLWQTIDNKYSDPKEVIVFHDGKGVLIKVNAGYKNPIHHYEHDIAVIIIEGDFNITLDNKTTSYAKGEYITIPANTCFNTFSKNGAMLAMLGATPGESKKNN